MPNSTCRLLSNGYKFNIDWDSSISYRPCCHFTKSQKLAAPAIEHQEFRQQLNAINSYESETCNNCNFQEKSKLRKTFRNYSFNWVPDDAEPGDASYLEIQTDNTCNGGCIICGPWHSSYWQSELKQFSIKPATDPIDRILSFIDIQKTRKILFLGGETFLTDSDTKVLSMIDHPELVDINYTTNGSIYPSDRRIKLWSQLKSVWINFSIDGIGDRFDYIRYPLKWSQVEKNIVRMLNELPENVRFKSNHTVNMLNLYYYDEFKEWYDRVMAPAEAFDFTFNPCSGILSPQQVPKKLFNMLLDKYGEDSKVIRTISNNNHDDQTDLLTYLSELDTRRGLNWRRVFPEISNCFV